VRSIDNIKDAILDYMDNRDNTELVKILNNNKNIFKRINKPLFRGFTTLKNSLKVGDKIKQIDFVTSWSIDKETAEYFAIYNMDLLAYDGIVLKELGVITDELDAKLIDIDLKVSPMLICCRNAFSCVDFDDYVTGEDLNKYDLRYEAEVVTFKNTEFIIKKIEEYIIDEIKGYLVEVEQIITND